MKDFLEPVLMLLISIPILIGVALPLRFFEQKFCQNWGIEHDIETRDKTFSLRGCEYLKGDEWRPFQLYVPAPKETPKKTQIELNKEFFDTHPDLKIPIY